MAGNEGKAAWEKAQEYTKKKKITLMDLSIMRRSFYTDEIYLRIKAWMEGEQKEEPKKEKKEEHKREYRVDIYPTHCEQCGEPIKQHKGDTRANYGRPQHFCSPACKQKAYRERKKK